jgi:hypothetical protein
MKVKSGDTPEEVFKKMLLQASHVTESMSRSIVDRFGSVHGLYNAWRAHGSDLLHSFEVRCKSGMLFIIMIPRLVRDGHRATKTHRKGYFSKTAPYIS